MLGFEQCCDANNYAVLGQKCWMLGWSSCWSEFRALGSTLLNALMYPYGLVPLSHALLLLFALFMTIAIEGESNIESTLSLKNVQISKYYKQIRLNLKEILLKALSAFLLLEFMFIGLASVNLTDVPAGVFAAFAILGFYRKDAALFALAAGVSVMIRAAYLYPMLAIATYFIAESLYKKNLSKAAVGLLFFICLAPQYLATYQHLGVFSFLDPKKVEYWRSFHFSSNLAGYDTLINPVTAHPWQSGVSLGLAAAFEQHNWLELIKLLVARFDFYFASYVPFGKVYLTDPGERIFNPLILILNLAAVFVSFLFLKAKGDAWRVWVPLLIIFAQSLLIIPEQRFIFVIQLFSVTLTYLFFCEYVLRRPRRSVNPIQ